jgi:hypothetical protein
MLRTVLGWLRYIYGLAAMIAMALSFIVFLLFALALVIGGQTGSSIAALAESVVLWGIRLAAAAILVGLISIYLRREHSLSMNSE